MSVMSPEPPAIPPYDAAWAKRLARLVEILDGVEITQRGMRHLEYLAHWDHSTDAEAELLEATRRSSYPKIELDEGEDDGLDVEAAERGRIAMLAPEDES